MILKLPSSSVTEQIVFGAYARDRWGRLNPHFVMIVGCTPKVLLGLFTRRSRENDTRLVWKRYD